MNPHLQNAINWNNWFGTKFGEMMKWTGHLADEIFQGITGLGQFFLDVILSVFDWIFSQLIGLGTEISIFFLDMLGIGDFLQAALGMDGLNTLIAAVSFCGNFVDFPLVLGGLGTALAIVVGMSVVKFVIKLIPGIG